MNSMTTYNCGAKRALVSYNAKMDRHVIDVDLDNEIYSSVQIFRPAGATVKYLDDITFPGEMELTKNTTYHSPFCIEVYQNCPYVIESRDPKNHESLRGVFSDLVVMTYAVFGTEMRYIATDRKSKHVVFLDLLDDRECKLGVGD